MWVSVSGGEPILVPPEQVQHFEEPPSHSQMIADFANIGTPSEWARRCGEKVGHDEDTWLGVAMLLIAGTKRFDPNSESLRGFRRLCPTADHTTFWIFRHTHHSRDDMVYQELCNCIMAYPGCASELSKEDFAVKALQHVAEGLARVDDDIMRMSFKGKGVSKGKTPHSTASSDSVQVEGKSKAKGSRPPAQS